MEHQIIDGKIEKLVKLIEKYEQIHQDEIELFNETRIQNEEVNKKVKRQKLFEPTLPPGAIFIKDIISDDIETTWIEKMNQYTNWIKESTCKKIQAKNIPEWIPKNQMEEYCQVSLGYFNEIIMNEFQPGQGIMSHIIDPDQYDDVICILSLGSDCVMELRPTGKNSVKESKKQLIPIALRRKSLLKLSGPSRYEWEHAIPRRQVDLLNSTKIERQTRFSITFYKKKNLNINQ